MKIGYRDQKNKIGVGTVGGKCYLTKKADNKRAEREACEAPTFKTRTEDKTKKGGVQQHYILGEEQWQS